MSDSTNINNEIQKPVSIIIEEAEQKIAQAVNETHLDPSILEPIIRNIYEQVVIAKKQQLAKDREMYENSLKNSTNVNNTKDTE